MRKLMGRDYVKEESNMATWHDFEGITVLGELLAKYQRLMSGTSAGQRGDYASDAAWLRACESAEDVRQVFQADYTEAYQRLQGGT